MPGHVPAVTPGERGEFRAVGVGRQVAPGAFGVHEVKDALFDLADVEGVEGGGKGEEES